MAQFIVPKFIEHEAKIVGPLTLKQFAFVGGAGAVCFFLYFTVSSYFFILASLVILLMGTGLAFGKIGGRSLPVALKNFFSFSFGPKIYLWKKKTGLPPKIKEEEKKPAAGVAEEMPVPMATRKSKLSDLSTHVETGAKKD